MVVGLAGQRRGQPIGLRARGRRQQPGGKATTQSHGHAPGELIHPIHRGVDQLLAQHAGRHCLAAIRQLALDVGIPKCLADLGVKEADIPLLATNALKDACGLTNPRTATQADIEGIFRGAMTA